MSELRPNILFIMADQLRWDYLSCAGHPAIRTPNIDALARGGVNLTRAYVQAPICGSSRMCFYTGRYTTTHGASYNAIPLRLDEKMIGDYLRPLGYRVAIVGKTHHLPDRETIERLGLDTSAAAGVVLKHGSFEPFERDDGIHPDLHADPNLPYNKWLREKGYEGHNPWQSHANSVEGDDGEVLSGWRLQNVARPARVKAEHSETAYMTDRAIDFMREAEGPWCLHLSYIKPHWPYVAPAPYHDMYGPQDMLAPNRSEAERSEPHPVLAAFMRHRESETFSRYDVRERVIPTYMGLISEVDHHLGRIVQALEAQGIADNTIIVFTSDHGDYLGDHWLGEKDMLHEEIVRVPLIAHDPRARADVTRGQSIDALVETIDLVPTFIDWAGGPPHPHRLEGRSLVPLLEGPVPADWRQAAFCVSDFSSTAARQMLGIGPENACAYMVRTARWKFIFYEGFRPQLFDLDADPHEQHDLGTSPAHAELRREMEERLFTWLRARKTRVTVTYDQIDQRPKGADAEGVTIGLW